MASSEKSLSEKDSETQESLSETQLEFEWEFDPSSFTLGDLMRREALLFSGAPVIEYPERYRDDGDYYESRGRW